MPDVDFTDLFTLAGALGRLTRDGYVVVLDEYQVFARRALFAFNSALQFEVDRLRAPDAPRTEGGLILLGSIQTEMEALLAGHRAPLFGRVTAVMDLDHFDPSVTAGILARHAHLDGNRMLFFWTLLQGIPKYWRDAYEVGALGADPRDALARLFFSGTAPLAADGAGWLLDELRGRYDPLLRYLADHPGAPRADITAHIAETAGHTSAQVGAWLAALGDRFRLVERARPAFGSPKSRDGRYRITDKFLVAWLGALADPVAFMGIRGLPSLLDQATARLASLQGHALERLAAALFHERSRRGLGDFPLSAPVRGWWDRTGAEVDLVAVDEVNGRLRVGSCKRSADRLVVDLPRFDRHVERMLERHPEVRRFRLERVAIAPILTPEHRAACAAAGYRPLDLLDLVDGLLP